MTDTPSLEAPHLFDGEWPLLESAMAWAAGGNYLEFGLGGSTLAAVRANFAQIVAVDTSLDWVVTARNHPEIRPRIDDNSAAILHADLGPVRGWGYPASRQDLDRWPRYIAAPWREWSRRGAWPNLVYVDGRFRVACCLSVALATGRGAGEGGEREPVRLLLHDVTDERPSYRRVLEFFDIVQHVNSLYLLEVKRRPDYAALVGLLLDQQFDPS
ncbi:hypothetical protein [Muricoccus pecuniae]|uniref:Class I SAM-dependent methyltransferase n=1 Tax=Muricoccus pecuniae TaxID=693023 RepID=A0A840Y0E4_9PROT|nr:hypothetical protein [Roseomonas pecuniae]MBB5693050.1 hypothetical protein [Roseomonas pecuniae]